MCVNLGHQVINNHVSGTNTLARSNLTEIPSEKRMKVIINFAAWVFQTSDNSIPTWSEWMDEWMNGKAAFECLLLTVLATGDLASGNRWELVEGGGWLGQRRRGSEG